jgi:hypothetical protein
MIATILECGDKSPLSYGMLAKSLECAAIGAKAATSRRTPKLALPDLKEFFSSLLGRSPTNSQIQILRCQLLNPQLPIGRIVIVLPQVLSEVAFSATDPVRTFA